MTSDNTHVNASAMLRRTALLAGASEDVVTRLASSLKELTVEAGQAIVDKGAVGEAAYIVASGRVRVHDGGVVLNTLGPGDVFGELSALDKEYRSASVTAETDTRLLRLDQDALLGLVSHDAAAGVDVIRGLCRMLRHRVQDISGNRQQIQLLEREMEIGRRIQASFLPSSIPQPSGWCIEADLVPAREVAGDFYDVFPVAEDDCIALVVGDVCDKGVGAALFMTLFRSLIRALAGRGGTLQQAAAGGLQTSAAATVSGIIGQVNDYVARVHSTSGMFTTLFFGVLDIRSGQLAYVNAGHEPPFVLSGGKVRLRLEPTGPVVGLFAGAQYGAQTVTIEPGEMLLAYTDGVTEARDKNHDCLGEDRLLGILDAPDRKGAGIVAMLKGELESFSLGAEQADDITMLAATRG